MELVKSPVIEKVFQLLKSEKKKTFKGENKIGAKEVGCTFR